MMTCCKNDHSMSIWLLGVIYDDSMWLSFLWFSTFVWISMFIEVSFFLYSVFSRSFAHQKQQLLSRTVAKVTNLSPPRWSAVRPGLHLVIWHRGWLWGKGCPKFMVKYVKGVWFWYDFSIDSGGKHLGSGVACCLGCTFRHACTKSERHSS